MTAPIYTQSRTWACPRCGEPAHEYHPFTQARQEPIWLCASASCDWRSDREDDDGED